MTRRVAVRIPSGTPRSFICMCCGFIFDENDMSRRLVHICLECMSDGTYDKAVKRGLNAYSEANPIGFTERWRRVIPTKRRAQQAAERATIESTSPGA